MADHAVPGWNNKLDSRRSSFSQGVLPFKLVFCGQRNRATAESKADVLSSYHLTQGNHATMA